MSRNSPKHKNLTKEKQRKRKFSFIIKNLLIQGESHNKNSNYLNSVEGKGTCLFGESFKLSELKLKDWNTLDFINVLSFKFDSKEIDRLVSKFLYLFSELDHLVPIFLIYIDKFFEESQIELSPDITLNVMIASCILSFKLHLDNHPPMTFFSKVFKIPVAQITEVEKLFLSVVRFNLICSEREFNSYERELEY